MHAATDETVSIIGAGMASLTIARVLQIGGITAVIPPPLRSRPSSPSAQQPRKDTTHE